jgi:hypothetical protein
MVRIWARLAANLVKKAKNAQMNTKTALRLPNILDVTRESIEML